jgi:hypothetical protein
MPTRITRGTWNDRTDHPIPRHPHHIRLRAAALVKRTERAFDTTCSGLAINDRVRHVSFGWDGVLTAFDYRGGAIAAHAMVSVGFNGGPARLVAVEIALLKKIYSVRGELA